MKLAKILVYIVIISLTFTIFYISKNYVLNNSYSNFIKIITNKFTKQELSSYKIDFLNIYINTLKEKNHFNMDKTNLNTVVFNENEVNYINNLPLIYLYSTHSNEEYSYNKNDVYNITPTVKTACYILENELKNLGIISLVEDKNTTDIINKKNMKYSESYKISRNLLENAYNENKSLKYFIDIHRDSVKRKVTTIEINGISYARIMFVLGLENDNYQMNRKLMEKIDNYLTKNYPGLSRGIYEKQGSGVNGIYNQDFNQNTILIEFGGVDNTIDEVANSMKIVANALFNIINEEKRQN